MQMHNFPHGAVTCQDLPPGTPDLMALYMGLELGIPPGVLRHLCTHSERNLRSAVPSTFGAMAVPFLADRLGEQWLMTAGQQVLGPFWPPSALIAERMTQGVQGIATSSFDPSTCLMQRRM